MEMKDRGLCARGVVDVKCVDIGCERQGIDLYGVRVQKTSGCKMVEAVSCQVHHSWVQMFR